MGAFLTGYIAAGIVAGIYAAASGAATDSFAVQMAGLPGLWLGLFGVPVLASRVWGTGSLRRDYGFAAELPGDAGVGLAAGLGGQLLVLVIVSLISLLSPHLKLDEASVDLAKRASGPGAVLLFAFVVVLAPIAEEVFFRGLLLRALSARVGPPAAVVVSGVLFGLVHYGGTGMGAVALVASLAAFGCLLGVLAVRRGRLGPAIVAHMVFNLVATIQIFTDSGAKH